MGRFGVGRAAALLVREAAQSADLLRAEAAYYAWGAAVFWGARTGSGVLHEGRDLLGEGWVYWMGPGVRAVWITLDQWIPTLVE